MHHEQYTVLQISSHPQQNVLAYINTNTHMLPNGSRDWTNGIVVCTLPWNNGLAPHWEILGKYSTYPFTTVRDSM